MEYLGINKKFQIIDGLVAAKKPNISYDSDAPSGFNSARETKDLAPYNIMIDSAEQHSTAKKDLLVKQSSSMFDEALDTPSTNMQSPEAKQPAKRRLGTSIPYIEAVRELEKMQSCVSPRNMLQCLSAAFAQLKSVVVDHHKGKLEL